MRIVCCQELIARRLPQRKNVRLPDENPDDQPVVVDQLNGGLKLDVPGQGVLKQGDPGESVPEGDRNAV